MVGRPGDRRLRGRAGPTGTGCPQSIHFELDGRRSRGSQLLRLAIDRPVPVEHLHGDAPAIEAAAASSNSSIATNTTYACPSTTSSERSRFIGLVPWSSFTSAATSRSISSGSQRSAVRRYLVLEDCAHAHGALWHGRPAALGRRRIWSFAPTKTMSTGEGGMLVSRHPELVAYARSFREYGKPVSAHAA